MNVTSKERKGCSIYNNRRYRRGVIWFLALVWVGLNVVDLGLTFVGVELGGYELNPVLLSLGGEAMVWVKMGVAFLVGGYIVWKEAVKLGVLACALVGVVVLWNTYEIWSFLYG